MLTKKSSPAPGIKAKGKSNGNIMAFFKKAESLDNATVNVKCEEEGLFLEDETSKQDIEMPIQTPTPPQEHCESLAKEEDVHLDDDSMSRFNEDQTSNKRRRTDNVPTQSPSNEKFNDSSRRGPFVDESDDENEPAPIISLSMSAQDSPQAPASIPDCGNTAFHPAASQASEDPPGNMIPQLKQEVTSIGEQDGFDGIDDFIDDEFPEEGEEYLERRWMEEQAEFEEGLEDKDLEIEQTSEILKVEEQDSPASVVPQGAGSTCCPICGGNTSGLSEQVGKTDKF